MATDYIIEGARAAAQAAQQQRKKRGMPLDRTELHEESGGDSIRIEVVKPLLCMTCLSTGVYAEGYDSVEVLAELRAARAALRAQEV